MSRHDDASLSRRRFLASAGALGAAAWLEPRRLLGEGLPPGRIPGQEGPVQMIRRAAATDPIQVRDLRAGMHLLSGSGGNVLAFSGADGVLLVDSGIVGEKVAAAVATRTRAPIRHLINTHWHFDHTDANGWLGERGAAIVAHRNTRRHLSEATRVEDWGFTFPPSPAAALPAATFDAEHSLRLNGSAIELRHFGPAHTDSDISVHLTDADVLHLGDVWWSNGYPFIDYSTGGSIDGTIRAAAQGLAAAGARTVIIPGHGPAGGRAELAAYHDMLGAVRERVAGLKRQGRTVAETVAARPTAAFDAAWGGEIIGPDFFTRLVYKGV